MADNFGKIQSGRVTDGDRFYAVPAADVAANVIFMPAYATSPFFGVAEYPCKAGVKGAFATTGVFAFDKPEGHTSAAGKAIYYKPSSAVAGTLSGTSSTGAVRIGYEVVADAPADKILVYLDGGDALIS